MAKAESARARLLVLGVGNPGRGDDGVGPAIAEALAAEHWPGVSVEAPMQLSLEHAAEIAEFGRVLFVDASVRCAGRWELARVAPAGRPGFSTHRVEPAELVAFCVAALGVQPEAWLLAVRGYRFGLGMGLSARAARNCREALAAARGFVARVQSWGGEAEEAR